MDEIKGIACLTFSYNMYGHHIGALEIVSVTSSGAYGPSQWVLPGEQGRTWKPVSVQVTIGMGEQVLFDCFSQLKHCLNMD